MNTTTIILAGITHSCYPNAAYNFKNELVLLMEVEPGDKLTVDYSTLFTGSEEHFTCSCGCNGCREIILGFDQLPVIIQEKYLLLDGVPQETLKSIDFQKLRLWGAALKNNYRQKYLHL